MSNFGKAKMIIKENISDEIRKNLDDKQFCQIRRNKLGTRSLHDTRGPKDLYLTIESLQCLSQQSNGIITNLPAFLDETTVTDCSANG